MSVRYGARHRWLRKWWDRRVRNAWGLGIGLLCWRCRQPIAQGQRWDLGHYDGSDIYAGPEHVACNRATAGRPKRATKPAVDWDRVVADYRRMGER